MRLRSTFLLAALALLALATGVAWAKNIDHLHKLKLTSPEPGTSAGIAFSVSQTPTKAGEQPPVVRKLKITLPKGSKIDTAGLTRCTATDDELQKQGDAACPASSKLGGGSATVFIGSGDLDLDTTLYNRKKNFAFVEKSKGAVVRVITAKLTTRTIRATLPKIALAGGKEVSIIKLKVTIPKHRKGKHVWLRTPKTCPKSKRWVSLYEPTFDPPHGTEHLKAKTVCKRS